jgi:putative transposase
MSDHKLPAGSVSFKAGRCLEIRMARLTSANGDAPKHAQETRQPLRRNDRRRCEQRKGIALNYIEPGEPNQNAYIERFNRTFRTEVLDAYLFNSVEQVQAIADDWRYQYNG